MNVHFSYKLPRTPDVDKEISHWTQKVEKRLQVFRPELVHLKGSLVSARDGTTVSLNLRLPSGQMAAQESASSATTALKAAFDDLLTQIGRHKDLLRNSHRWRRRRTPAEPPPAEVPFEETIASVPTLTASSEDIRSFVNANLRRLNLFVQRELSFRENSGQLQPEALSVEEIVDEAVASALDEDADKPDRLGLEAWLYRMAIRAMNDFESQSVKDGNAGRTGSRSNGNEQASDEQHLQFFQPDESALQDNETIPDSSSASPEEIAYADEMITLVQFALKAASRQDREAFILHAIEGFTVSEIGAITDRNPEQVKESILRAREKLQHSLPIDNAFKDPLLQRTGTA
jgi:RNA polymerase sigma factor (sigma-70 family)